MADQQVYSLSYSVRGRVVLKYFGQLCLVLAALKTVCLFFSIFAGEYSFTFRLTVIILILGIMGLLLNRLKVPRNIQPNEAFVITAFIFTFGAIVNSYPLMIPGLSFEDALFESVSAITTTGLTTLSEVEDKPLTFLFTRSYMQWYGGLGIVVLSVALLTYPGTVVRRLVEIKEREELIGGTRLHAQKVFRVYIAITAAGLAALMLSGVKAFPALIHTLSAVSTGGFSTYNNSISGIGNWTVRSVVMLICLSGSISFTLYYLTLRQGIRRFIKDPEVHAIILLGLVLSLMLTFTIWFQNGPGLKDTIGHAMTFAFSAQTTTGFSTLHIRELAPASMIIIILSMFLGGNIGSTAGGIKMLRLLILIRMIKLTIAKTCLPEHAVLEPRIGGQRLESEEIERSLLVILLFIIVIVLSWIPFVFMGYEPLDALFEVVSATGTVGLSTGITASGLPALLKGVLCADMLMGRLEIIAILVLLYPWTWFGRRVESL